MPNHPEPNHPELLVDGPHHAAQTLILAHGAGAAMDSDFMNVIALAIAARGVRVVRFEFPYMAQHRTTGKRRPPDREPVLRETWRNVITRLQTSPIVIGGKSIQTPTLIIQGERDALGNRDEVAGFGLSPQIQLHWLSDGDHSFKPRVASGRSLDDNLDEAVAVMGTFLVRCRS